MTTLLAVIFDTMLGDPRSKYHPVVLIGKMIAICEAFFYRQEDSHYKKLLMGGILTIIVLAVTFDVALGISKLAWLSGSKYMAWFLEAFCLSFLISPRSLAAAGRSLRDYLLSGDLEGARQRVAWIVGRDTGELDVGGVTRATVETIAENTVDGIISPLFFFMVGGLPLAALYRAANTMDSMIGYKNDKYLYFGRAAARLDDVLNYIPARLTGLLFVAAAVLLQFDAAHAWRMMMRDASKHPSPNGGYAEATVAGALHIRLGGMNSYFGKPSFRAYMGEPLEELGPQHIDGAIRLMYGATLLFLAAALIVDSLMGVPEMRSFFIGLQFLTRIFVVHQDNWTEEDFGRSVRWFALIGAVLGCIYAATAYVATLFLPEHGVVLPHHLVTAILLILPVILTGGLHCDGFMDTMDGLFSGRKRERMLEIMKDSRTGSMGVAAFVCVAAIDWSLLLDMDSRWLVPALFVMPVLGRLMMAAAVTFFPYARPEGMGRAFAAYATPKVFWAELCYALLLVLPGGKLSVLAVLVCMAFTSVLARYAVAKLGGLTGDVYGAIEKLNETVVLLVFLLGSYLL